MISEHEEDQYFGPDRSVGRRNLDIPAHRVQVDDWILIAGTLVYIKDIRTDFNTILFTGLDHGGQVYSLTVSHQTNMRVSRENSNG